MLACPRLVLLAAVVWLAGCADSPAPEFIAATRHEVERDGRRYVIWQKETRAEIVRLGPARPGEHREIRATMIALLPEITGCALIARSLQGDSGEMRASLTCPG